jgi:hypothetical protein
MSSDEEEKIEIKKKDEIINNSNKEVLKSSLKNAKFKGLTSEQIIRKYEDVLNSREKQFYDLSKERGKLSQRIQLLEEKREKSKKNNDKLKEVLSKYDLILKQELRNKELEFMKLTNLENKYDDLQNKIDYIINKQNALYESSKMKNSSNQNSEEIKKLIDKNPPLIQEENDFKDINNNIKQKEQINLNENTKEENPIIEKDENETKLLNEDNNINNNVSNKEKENNEIKESNENKNKNENKHISARERLNKLKEKKGKVQKLNLSEFLNNSNNNNINI